MYDPTRPDAPKVYDVAMKDYSSPDMDRRKQESPPRGSLPTTANWQSGQVSRNDSPMTNLSSIVAGMSPPHVNGGTIGTSNEHRNGSDRDSFSSQHRPSLSTFSLHNNAIQAGHSDFLSLAQQYNANESIGEGRSASQAMSISAMLSNPVGDNLAHPSNVPNTPPGEPQIPVKPAKRAYRKRGTVTDVNTPSAKKAKIRAGSDVKESKKRKDGRNKPRSVPDVYDLENALYDSDESDPSEDEQYLEIKSAYMDRWSLKCAKIAGAEAAAAAKRRSDTSSRILTMLDRRVRKSQKAFENRHQEEAYQRATFEDGVRKHVRRLEALQARKQNKLAAMAGSAMSKRSKKRKRDSMLPPQQAKADLEDTDSVLGLGKGSNGSNTDKLIALQDSIWRDIARKEIPKVYRIIQTNTTHRNMNIKKTTQLCAKEARRWQFRTNKTAKDMIAKSKRAMREMLIFWKKNERGDLLNRQKAERDLIDKAKKEEESREARRQARKLNFLITQTELYSHFIGNKIKTAEAEQSEDTASDANPRLVPTGPSVPTVIPTARSANASAAELDFDADDDEALQAAAARNAQEAIQAAKAKAQGFDTESGARPVPAGDDAQANVDAMDLDFQNPTTLGESEVSQPRMLNATLKEYQLKGLNWLVNLYEQGINGILADEMGLGKTVQSISVMAHLAETYNIWGPFLVIAPASTLHNWQQEISKFVPRLKALPYWGNTKDRKVLRKFWDRKRATYSEDAPFHVVVTSYQLVVQDSQYFQNVKWQYMILDEAQAIKSSQSSRWKNLLAFKCRNRLLLTGTPIQNTMQELWALLHFIMPSLFDSHNEFSEWFAKDIENHAQKNSELNETQLRRLHMILKPFMLRRVKKNVQKELGDKIELDVFCDLNMRQRSIYSLLRKEISMKDIIEKASSDRDADLSSLMNLVMQLRKVCNHPDLFERADVRTPLALVDMPKTANLNKEGRAIELSYASTSSLKYNLPRLISDNMLRAPAEQSRAGFDQHYLGSIFSIFSPYNIARSLTVANGAFSWSRFTDLSPAVISSAVKDPVRQLLQDGSTINHRELCNSNGPSSGTSITRMFQIIEHNRQVAPELPSKNILGSLMSIHKAVALENRLNCVNPMYDPKVVAPSAEILCCNHAFTKQRNESLFSDSARRILYGLSLPEESDMVRRNVFPDPALPATGMFPAPSQAKRGFGNIRMPSMQTFITDSGKLSKLDELLSELKKNDHRVLLYFQMTKMIDLMEEYLVYRQYKYLRLDGSSKISDRRDMVNDWQTRPELFVFLLSTRAGGLGINLTAADTVIFYDSDWNPTIDSQAMDRAHRLGQTKQVTVYRLITRGTIEERILSRAKQKEEVQKVVISGGDYKQGTTDNLQFQSAKGSGGRDVVSWLLEDDDQAKEVEKRLEHQTPAKQKSGKPSKDERAAMTMDDMYHEGEAEFERGTGLNTPDETMSELGNASASASTGAPPKRKKSTPKKRKMVPL